MRFLSLLLLGAFFTIALPASSYAKDDIVSVLFYADWCGSCKILDPKVEKARENKAAEGIEFIVLDMTDKNSIANSRQVAEEQDLSPLLQKYGAATGFMVIYDRTNDDILSVVGSGSSPEEIISQFEKAKSKQEKS